MDLILSFIVMLAAGFTIYYSYKTRSYRKQGQFNWMKFYNAKTNIAMGTLLIALAIIQFSFDHLSGWRLTVGIAFLALGLVNLVVGIRHYQHYRLER